MQDKLHPRPGILQIHEQVPGLLDHSCLGRVLGGSEDAYPADAVLNNGKDVGLRSVEQAGAMQQVFLGDLFPGIIGSGGFTASAISLR